MDQDLFEAGMDSLQVIRMARELRFQAKRAGLGKAGAEEFPPTAVYSYPTLNQLTKFILRQVNVKTSPNGYANGTVSGHISSHVNGHTGISTLEYMQALLQTYISSLSHSNQPSPPPLFQRRRQTHLDGSQARAKSS